MVATEGNTIPCKNAERGRGGGERKSNFIETQLHGFAIMSKIFSIELGLFWQGKLTRLRVLVKLSFFVLRMILTRNSNIYNLSLSTSDDKNVTKDHFWIRGGDI